MASPSHSSRSDIEWCDALLALGAVDFFVEALDLALEALDLALDFDELFLDDGVGNLSSLSHSSRSDSEWCDALLALGAVGVFDALDGDLLFTCVDFFFREALDLDELDGGGECMRAACRWRSDSRKRSVSALYAAHASASRAASSRDVVWDAELDAVE